MKCSLQHSDGRLLRHHSCAYYHGFTDETQDSHLSHLHLELGIHVSLPNLKSYHRLDRIYLIETKCCTRRNRQNRCTEHEKG